MPGAFPDGDKENEAPAIPHGLSNKKRARAASPFDEVIPVIAHGLANKKRARAASPADDDEGEQPRSPKKRRGNATEVVAMAPKIVAEQMAPKSKIPSPAKKGGLSLSRLKMLAMPKSRR